ncbi:fimbrial biogenesis chaperone [Phyllobacterium lublinensis]|uniref:fimbrial biogenesis chaperone n=1 Tax=Phyllobacterium lublinensis TaxID=2875708 RepID=UPI001CCDEA36|nr:molecular chaperone [Phyllobacterium sp. 2063]MBZ9657089.1 molecular chaperone [Phyllobacterium sp. 2063]
MRPMLYGISAMSLVVPFTATAQASSLRLSPTNLEIVAPASAGMLTLTNDGTRPIQMQVRIYRWTQSGGEDHLEPADDVVASPPLTTLPANKPYQVRIIRIAHRPVTSEESYRVVVDELPDPNRKRAGAVALVVRYSLPVFFKSEDATPAEVKWGLVQSKGNLLLTAHNAGNARLRLSDVQLVQGGRLIGGRKGLVGYVLGGASMQWPILADKKVLPGNLTFKGQSESGPFNTDLTK